MGAVQTLEAELAEKNEHIKEIELELQAAKKRAEREPASEPVYKQQAIVPPGSSVKERRNKDLEKRVSELEERLAETKRKNGRLEMLNDQLSDKLRLKTQEADEKAAEFDKAAAKLGRKKTKIAKLKGMLQKYYPSYTAV